MLGFEAPEPRHQPFGGEGRGGRHRQSAAVFGRGEQRRRLRQAVEGLAQRGQGSLGAVGEQQPLRRTLEQRRADVFFQVLDLLADRAGGHGKLVRGPAEIHVTGRRFEGPQGVQWRKPAAIHRFPNRKNRTSAGCEVAP